MSARSHGVRAEMLCARLAENQLTWRSEPERWGVASCFEHLLASARLYHPRIRAAIEESRSKGWIGKDYFRPTWLGSRLLAATGPQVRKKLRAPQVLEPTRDGCGADWRAWLDANAELVALLEAADGLDLSRARVRSPASRFVRLRLGEALTMLVLHDERHLMQAERVRAQRSFPSGAAATKETRQERGGSPAPALGFAAPPQPA